MGGEVKLPAAPVSAKRSEDGWHGGIVFLAVNASYSHSNLAGWYLQEIAEAAGWRWTEIELTLREDPQRAIEEAVRTGPRVLAATFYLFNRNAVLSFIRRFKALCPSCIVIGGGPEFLADNRGFLATERNVDVVVRGEGELAFAEFLRRVNEPVRWREIPGLCGFHGGEYFDGGFAQEIANLDEIASPYARRAGRFPKPFVQLETSRGCSNRCAFCTSGRGGPVRYASLRRARADLDAIRRMGTKGVRLVDRTFNERPARCIRLLQLFRNEYPDLRFHLEMDPARLTRSILDKLAAAHAGRFHIEAGIQSLSPEVYRNIGRRATVGRSLDGLKALCRLRNLDVHADLVAGLPGGDLEGLFEETRTLVCLGPGEIQMELLKILPGTALDRDRHKWGITASAEPPYVVLSTGEMTAADLRVAAELSKLLDHYYNASPLQEAVAEATEEVNDFWPRFHAFRAGRGKVGMCPGLEERFQVLDEFLEKAGVVAARHRLRYAWMKWGLSPRRGLCRARPWRGPVPQDAVLVEGDSSRPFSRRYGVELDRPYLFAYGREGGDRRATAVFVLPRQEEG